MRPLFDPTRDRDKGPAGRMARSRYPARQIRDRLRGAGCLAPRDVRDGVAFLDGRMRHHHLRQVARAIVRVLDGVGGVEDRIQVIPVAVVEGCWRVGKSTDPRAY